MENLIEWLKYQVKVAKYVRDRAIYESEIAAQDGPGGGTNPPPPPPPPPPIPGN